MVSEEPLGEQERRKDEEFLVSISNYIPLYIKRRIFSLEGHHCLWGSREVITLLLESKISSF